MVRCDDFLVLSENDTGRDVKATLVADDSSEVTMSTGEGIDGLRDTDRLALGSSCFTAKSEYGVIDSTGTWNW